MTHPDPAPRHRELDLVLFGAGGFVGRQTVEYVARLAPEHGLRWAIAGPRRATLEAAKAAAGAPQGLEAIVADGRDRAAVDALASRTRVVLSTAGPFALYGDELVSACVARGTDYVDITGETPWVRSLIDRHHDQAARQGTRIVPCCGYDSVPSDLGVLLAVRHLQERWGEPCRDAVAYFQMQGGLNGGTAATAVNLHDSGQAQRAADPFLLSPGAEPTPEMMARSRDPAGARLDRALGVWIAPHVMGAINTRVVRRSAALFDSWGEEYGPTFAYQEYTRFAGPLASLKARMMTGSLALFERGLRQPAVRRVIRRALPRPGAGPSRRAMDEGWFRCDVRATAVSGRQVRVLLTHQGDPGNRATVRFVCESALCLLQSDAQNRGGVLTPATAFGLTLAARLRGDGPRKDGLTVEMSDLT